MRCYFLSLDMDGSHISDPHIPMRTLYACVYCVPGCPRDPHPLTRLCVWRLLPQRVTSHRKSTQKARFLRAAEKVL